MPLTPYLGAHPFLSEGTYVHDSAHVIGDVRVGRDSSIWCNTVLRGDVNRIVIGDCSNIQDFAMGLVAPGKVLESEYLYVGRPAIRGRALNSEELAYLKYSAEHYVCVKNNYKTEALKVGGG